VRTGTPRTEERVRGRERRANMKVAIVERVFVMRAGSRDSNVTAITGTNILIHAAITTTRTVGNSGEVI